MSLVQVGWMASALALGTGNLSDPPDEWSRFRGPNGSGRAVERTYPSTLDPKATLVWRQPIGAGVSSPCVAGDRLFLTEHGDQELATVCLDCDTGKVLWRRAITVEALERIHDINSPASPTPTTDGERVVVYFGSFGLLCFDRDGEELWRRPLPMPRSNFGTAASPILAGDRVVFVHGSRQNPYVEAFAIATGESVWRQEQKVGWSTPGVWRNGDVDEVLVNGEWWLKAYDLRDGAERWAVPGLTDEPIVTPVTSEGLVYVTSYNMNNNPDVIGLPPFDKLLEELDGDGDGELSSKEADANESVLSRFDADGEGDHPLRMFFRFLDEDKNDRLVESEWKKIFDWLGQYQHVNALLAIRPGSGERETEIVWQQTRGIPECPSPLVYRGHVYLIKNGGILSCLDAKTGELRYRERLEAQGPYYASPVAVDGKIYLASTRGEVTVLMAGEKLQVVSRTDLDERVMATPALVEGRVYLRTDKHVLAFGSPTAKADRGN